MRKINSEYKTAFISEAGSEVINNDYFGFVELDDFACYVVADGLYSGIDAESAKIAIEAVIGEFQESPSTRKSALKRYLKAANKRLIKSGVKRQSLKASVAMVVTNYEAMRYAIAGNVRMIMYRGDKAYVKSADTTLAQNLMERENGAQDKIARHNERNNMYAFLGQVKGFSPHVSKKIPLMESDVITLYTRGIWENIDEGELSDVFSEAKDEPRESVDMVEDLLLSRQPEKLENYTFAAIFVNKVFEDPKRKKKLTKIIIIAVIALVIIAAVIIISILFTRYLRQTRAEMEELFTSAVAHIERGSYARALTDAEASRKLAKRLRDNSSMTEIDEHIGLIETVIRANELLDGKRYQESQDMYLAALKYDAELDGISSGYIDERLKTTEGYIHFFTLMELASSLAELENFDKALSLYKEARTAAASLYFADGRQQAIDGITDMLERITRAEEEAKALEAAKAAEKAAAEAAKASEAAAAEEASQQAAQEKAASELAAAELLSQGDQLFLSGDYAASLAFFQNALEAYRKLGDLLSADMAKKRIDLAESRLADRDLQEKQALEYLAAGDQSFEDGDYDEANRLYKLAKQIFESIGIPWRVTQMEAKLDMVQQTIEKRERETRQNMEDQAADYFAQGDIAYNRQKYDLAMMCYIQARKIYGELGSTIKVMEINERIETLRKLMAENNG